MFAQTDGPTALRRDLVHALSVSQAEVPVELEPGTAPLVAVAAVGGVWNGRKGYVAVLLRVVDPPALQRFTYKESVDTPEDLERAVREAITFVEDYGFQMGDAGFRTLAEAEQIRRMRVWDAIRKLAPDPLQGRRTSADPLGGSSPAPLLPADDGDGIAPRGAGPGDSARGQRLAPDLRSGQVLGRMQIVRRQPAELRVRLLGQL
jgi:hypothetical protein